MPLPSYRDSSGVVSRANSAMLRIEQIIEDRACPSEIRLVRIAQVMAEEPILTDESTAASRARRDAARWTARRIVYVDDAPEPEPVVLPFRLTDHRGDLAVSRIRVIGGPDEAAIGQSGTVQRQEPGWENDGMVLVTLDNGLDGLWWPEHLEEITAEPTVAQEG